MNSRLTFKISATLTLAALVAFALPAPVLAQDTAEAEAGALRADPQAEAKAGDETALTEAEKKAAAQKAAEEKKKQQELNEKQRLAKIVLPDNPTREQCEAYIAKLRKHTEGRNSFSSGDDEVDKLKAIPAEHVDLILNEMTGNSGLRFYSRYAIKDIDVEEHKDKIVARLDQQPNNILFIVHYGWFQAAEPAILSRLENADPTTEIEPAWFQAFVEVAEPKHHKKLHEIAVNAKQIDDFVPLLETLPDYDLNHTVNAAWNTIDKHSRDYYARRKRETLAPYAARFGEVEALGILIEQLQNAPDYNMRLDRVNQERLNIARLIDFRGSDKEIEAWYEQNKDKLVFDNFRKKFVVQEGFE